MQVTLKMHRTVDERVNRFSIKPDQYFPALWLDDQNGFIHSKSAKGILFVLAESKD